jgi:hypothetical protein
MPALAEVATCQTCGKRIVRKLLSGVFGHWLHELDSEWFNTPHPALPDRSAA